MTDKKNNLGRMLFACGATGLVVMLMTVAMTQCSNKNAQNQELKKELRTAQEQNSKLYDRVRSLDVQLDDCRNQNRPASRSVTKTAPKPVAKPVAQPKPTAKPATQTVTKTVVVYDTVRKTVSEPETIPVADEPAKETKWREYRTVVVVNASADGYCVASSANNGANAASTAAADTVRNAIVADTISNVR